MPPSRSSVLLVTDLTYQARGRRYCDEDIFVSARLRRDFDVALCHPLDAAALMQGYDAVVVRNSGPVIHYRPEYDELCAEARRRRIRMFNSLDGKADMVGKQYLVDLSDAGFPVIPTTTGRDGLTGIPAVAEYVLKPIRGADSIGLRTVAAGHLERELADLARAGAAAEDVIVQPRVPFEYEVSFFFVGRTFHYAMYAPDPDARWALRCYRPSAEDLAFAQHFVDWNAIDHGVQRVDACRTFGGALLLVEIEDLNPYLSLDLLDEPTRDSFMDAMSASIRELLAQTG
jgi:hypothetical protein